MRFTMRVPPDLDRLLRHAKRRSGRPRGKIVRDALRRQLLREEFEALRRATLPFAEARGYLTDEDAFRDVS